MCQVALKLNANPRVNIYINFNLMTNNSIIGFWGLSFNSGNMGCNALSYSFLHILGRCTTQKLKVYVFYQGNDFDTKLLSTDKITVVSASYNPRSLSSMKTLVKRVKECVISFDFTAGDSFSDIYGMKGFIKSCLLKKMAMRYSGKFVLGPQTYGPYYHKIAQKIAKDIIVNADYACSRDNASAEYVNSLFGIKMDVFTDVAFALPFVNGHTLPKTKKKVGINVSGLLWRGGYTGNNQFGLKVDYRSYIKALIKELEKQVNIDVYIIPHVVSVNGAESDYAVSEQIAKEYTHVHLAPRFNNPIEAKSFIAEMDVFTGARMHATIGAFSAGVVTIPFSYSRKFEGLYENLGYPYTINARQLSTQEAVDRTLNYIKNHDKLKIAQMKSFSVIEDKLKQFEINVTKLLNE